MLGKGTAELLSEVEMVRLTWDMGMGRSWVEVGDGRLRLVTIDRATHVVTLSSRFFYVSA